MVNLSVKDQISDNDHSQEIVEDYTNNHSLNNEIIASYDTAKPMSRFSLRNERRRRMMHNDSEMRKKAFQKWI